MLKDLRYGFRTLWKSPGFTLLAVLALALGIGANTAIFSVVNAVMLQRLPFRNPARIAMIWEVSPRSNNKTNVVNPGNFLEWQERNHSFERIGALTFNAVSLSGEGEPEQVDSALVTDGVLPTLGVKPIVGRWFTSDEYTSGHTIMLSEGLWRRRYAADPGIVGRQITVDHQNTTVAGVLPANFRFPFVYFLKTEVWQPFTIASDKRAGGRYLLTIARLKERATISSAQAEMNVIAAQLQHERPEYDANWGINVVGLPQQAVGDARTPLMVLMGAVGLVLLIACANVANLMLMRCAGRGREMAVRAALGAGPLRIVRQLLAESTLLAIFGGALGLLVGVWAVDVLAAFVPDTIALMGLNTIHLNPAVFAFTTGVSLATGILFGLAPALKASRLDVQQALKDGGRSVASGRSFMRAALVVAQIAFSMVLLTGAGLLIRSFLRLANVDPGFDATHVLSMQIATPRFANDEKFLEFDNRMLERVRAVPGVEAVGTSHFLPLGSIIPGSGFWRADQARPQFGKEPVTEVLVVMPGYFAAMNIPLIRGRVYTDRDRKDTPLAVVINQTLAKQQFQNEDPIGKRLFIQWVGPPQDTYEIVGVVGDVHQAGMDKNPKPGVFISNLQKPGTPVNLVVRTHGDARQLAGVIQKEIHSLDREMPISDVRTMDQAVSASVAAPRFNTILLGGFAVLALVLSAVGIFGVISYSVAQRTQEIGIRRALGAGAGTVMRLVLQQGLVFIAIGVGLGLAGALAVTRLLQSLLFGVTPEDPVTFVAVSLFLILVALLASYLPARRAMKVDPMIALRYE